VNLKSETPTDDGIKTVPTKHHAIDSNNDSRSSLKRWGAVSIVRLSNRLTMYQSANSLRSVKRFEIEVEVVDRDMKTDDAVSSF
jgi:hypothetical protein